MGHAKTLGARQKIKSEKTVVSTGFIIVVIIAVALALFYVRFKVEELRIGYEISRNNREAKELLKERRILESEYMRAKSPDRLEKIALEMGFMYPTQQDIVHVEKSPVVGSRK